MAERVTTERAQEIAHFLCDKCALDTIGGEVLALARERDELAWSLTAATRRIETLQAEVTKWERFANECRDPHNATAKCT